MQNKIECPVSLTTLNQTKVRLVAAFVFTSAVLYLLFPHWSIAAVLAVDFFLRGFGFGRYSIFGWMSEQVVIAFSLPQKRVDAAPKEFAAQVGFIISDCLFIFSFFAIHTANVCLAGLLICFSFLEAFVGFCAGCWLYTLIKRLKLPASNLTG